jgi:3,4-dihydroxy 2-butanone 4-phosphate synthase/GTP cyclohydrolase II
MPAAGSRVAIMLNASPHPEAVLPSAPEALRQLIQQLQHAPGAVVAPAGPEDRPLRGTTLFLAKCNLDTHVGRFIAYVFQDIIHKGYLIALAHGDLVGAKELYTRIHSSCITSETLRGCDCDCVQQLEGALKVISERGDGILFYLMQEGRGVGYVAKARDRMLVQSSQDQISTFEAYHAMGLRKDHRSYEDVADICYLLGIQAPFVVLTNNPDKLAAMQTHGLKVARAEALEFEPSPFNVAYLASKAASGHLLTQTDGPRVKRALPPEPIQPFKPHALPEARRFIYSASYFLPVKPVENEIILSEPEFHRLFDAVPIESLMQGDDPAVRDYFIIRGNRLLVRINPAAVLLHARENPDSPVGDLLTTPYWFRVHVYFDIVTSQEAVVLTYGKPEVYDLPVVRLQSESLFNRLPLVSKDNRDKFKRSVRHIVHHGVGALFLLYFDGRGAGFGAYATDRMMTESGASFSSDEAYRLLGVGYDSRDYDAIMRLLKHHYPSGRIQMAMNSPSSLVKKKEYATALNAHGIDVHKWIFLDDNSRFD